MNADTCVYCNNPVPEGRMVCYDCEQEIMKMGRVLQSLNATEEETQRAYETLEKELRCKNV